MKQRIKEEILHQIRADWATPEYSYTESWFRKIPGVIAVPLTIGFFAVLIYGLVKLIQYLV